MIEFTNHSGIYTLTAQQKLPIALLAAWDFFASPKNLERITPKFMKFSITSGLIGKVYPGQIITYKVSPFPGLRMNWVTEITHVSDGEFFTDEQRFGPYAMWHHEHHFEEVNDGVWMTDKISYKIPFGFIGRIAHALFVKKQLTRIFQYRMRVLEDMFGGSS